MTVNTGGRTTTLTCQVCNKASMSISKSDVPAMEWSDNKGWKQLREKAWRANWRISGDANGDHYCPKCIAAYDF